MWGATGNDIDVAEVDEKKLTQMVPTRAIHEPVQDFGRGGRSRTCECRNQNPVP